MGPAEEIDLFAPIMSDTILELRKGKMKPMEGITATSGIDKTQVDGAVASLEALPEIVDAVGDSEIQCQSGELMLTATYARNDDHLRLWH